MFTRQGVLIHLPRCLAVGVSMVFLSVPALAVEACSQWDLQGTVLLVQSNNQLETVLQLEQIGSELKGAARYAYTHEDNVLLGISKPNFREATGPVVGTALGNAFEATVYWSNKSVGVYTGQIGPQGLLVGSTYDKTDPAATADFHSEKPFVCLTRAQSAPGLGAASAKPPVALGRVQTSAPTPSSTSICDAAQSARARNSPAAPGLERQCKALSDVHRPQTVTAIRVAPGKNAKDTGVPAALKAAGVAGATEAPRLNSRSAAASAGMATTPRPMSPLPAAVRSPADVSKNKTDAVLLNPQPLPPAVVAPAQVPSALR